MTRVRCQSQVPATFPGGAARRRRPGPGRRRRARSTELRRRFLNPGGLPRTAGRRLAGHHVVTPTSPTRHGPPGVVTVRRRRDRPAGRRPPAPNRVPERRRRVSGRPTRLLGRRRRVSDNPTSVCGCRRRVSDRPTSVFGRRRRDSDEKLKVSARFLSRLAQVPATFPTGVRIKGERVTGVEFASASIAQSTKRPSVTRQAVPAARA